MRVVITGPTGTIGHALINLLLSNGDEVLAICHKNSSRISSLPKDSRLKVLELDLSEYSNFALKKIEEYGKYDCFYHFAWHGTVGKDRLDAFMQTKNIMYSLDAVELAKFFGCDTFIGAGSQAEYGRVEAAEASQAFFA